MRSASQSLGVFEKALSVTENNVSNASTPSFAKQRLPLESLVFDAELGLPGGVEAGEVQSLRNGYAEQNVRRRQQAYARSEQMAAELARIEPLFDATGESGIPAALSNLFQSFSAWSVAPNDTVARRAVIERAGELSARVRETAGGLVGASINTEALIRDSVETINTLAGRLRDLNIECRRDYRNLRDPGLDARLHSLLEELAQYADFTTLRQPDGSVTVLLGGQTPLVIGESQYEISADTTGAVAVVRDANGVDITAQVTEGRLGAFLEIRNNTIPGFLADLNRLAATLADRVNEVLAAGLDANGQPGAPLFAYDAPENAAFTLQVTGITPSELAAATAGAPGGNGNALDLAALAESQEIDGFTFVGFYATLARGVGHAIQGAREDQQRHNEMLLQARSLRNELSGVSLDEEAIYVMSYQRSYQALTELIGILSRLLDSVFEIMR